MEVSMENKKISNKILILIFCLSLFALETTAGIYQSYYKGILLNDAFSRTANAFYVLFVKPYRFASIGLIWNPLPSIMQLPFIELAKFWRPIASSGISGDIVTAIFAALSAGILLNTFFSFKISRKYSIVMTLLYVFNPFIFFYGCNGMSESIFFTFLIYAVCNLTLWIREGKSEYIVKIAFSLIGLFFTRYEAIPFAMAIGISIVIIIWFSKKEKVYWPSNNNKEHYYYLEGSMIVLYTPLAYGIFMWIMFNLIIMGKPFYFLNSIYSNVSQSMFSKDFGSAVNIVTYVSSRLVPFIPLFMGILFIRIMKRKVFKIDFFLLTILVFSLIIFHYFMLLKGNSFGWLRFFSYSLPICMAWVPYEVITVKNKHEKAFILTFVISLILSSALCVNALKNPELAKEEQNVMVSSSSYKVSDYINNKLPDQKIMMDAFLTNSVILKVNNIDNLIVSSSLNFYECLNDPRKNGVDYILVPDSGGVGHLDAINATYDDLYNKGAEWCKEEAEFDGFKLYKVIN